MTPSDAPETSPWLRLTACLAVLATLAACGGTPTQHRAATAHYSPSRYYPPPGPASDPWGPYITEASGRFGVPQTWIRSVMRQESGGQEDVISWAGAMGLMQVMPQTYEELRARYNLGDDPYDPHNNIMAGTAYLREMYDRYGSPGFLAAYNAGPNRLDRYLASGTPLPDETVNYVASIAPRLGPGTPMSGPLAVYAGGAVVAQATYRPRQSGCDPDAAYNPDGPCTKLQPPVIQTVSAVPYVPQTAPYTSASCDPDAAYDPSRQCQPAAPAAVAPTVVAQVLAPPVIQVQPARSAPPVMPPPSRPPMRFATETRPLQERMRGALPVAFTPGPPPGRWMIQVGAFATLSTAEAAAEAARSAAPDLLRITKIELPATAPLGTQVAFRARLAGLSQTAAAEACGRLSARGMACITVPPSRDSF